MNSLVSLRTTIKVGLNNITLEKRGIQKIIFLTSLWKHYVVSTHLKCLCETLLMSTHNIIIVSMEKNIDVFQSKKASHRELWF